MTMLLNRGVIGIIGAVVAVVLVVILIVKRYRVVDPDTAMIVVGNKGKGDGDLTGQKVITGGGAFIWPFVQKAYELSLRSRQLGLQTEGQTKNGITINAKAVAVIKVGGTENMIRSAAQRFLSQQDEIERSAQEVLSGSLRSIIGSLTVQEIIQDRQAVARLVLEAAEEALSKQGLVIDTLQIQEIRDSQNYIENIGKPEAAAVRQAAEIADIEAQRASKTAEIEANKEILNKDRELKIKAAEIKKETDRAAAEAEAAKPLEDARQQQQILEQKSLAAEREALLKEQVLNAEVRKVADAEAYRVEQEAKASAEATRLLAQAEKEKRVLESEAVAAEGEAEATAISAKGKAEGDAIEARAKALEKQSQAVLAQQIIDVMPLIAEKLANAYAGIDNLTVVSADGANKITGDVIGNFTGISSLLKDATGIDLPSIISGKTVGQAVGTGIATPAPTPAPVTTSENSRSEVSDSEPHVESEDEDYE